MKTKNSIESPGCRPPSAGRPRVVILEDDQALAQLYETLIMKHYAQAAIRKHHNGDPAWVDLSRSDPDIFITDLDHLGLDIWEILKRLAAKPVTYPILIITDEGLREVPFNLIYPGLNLTVMYKPFEVERLQAMLVVTLSRFTIYE